MHLTKAIVAALLVSVAFSGCSDKQGGSDEDGGSTGTASGTATSASGKTRSGTGTSSSTGTSGSAGGNGNQAPIASLSASVANGTVPLNVTFTVSGSDPDGDGLNWTLDFGDGSAPAQGATGSGTANHTFAAQGNYTVALVVSDGTSNASANVTIAVAAGGGSANSFIVTLADICAAPEPCTRAPNGCPDFRARTPGTYCAWFPIPPALHGKAFKATSTGGDPDLTFTASPNGGACAFPVNEVSRTSFVEVGPEAGTIPATSATGGFAIDCVTFIEFEATPSTITFSWS